MSTDDATELEDLLADATAVAPDEAAALILLLEETRGLLGRLEARERRVLELRFGLDRGEARTLEEVSEHFDLTRERIRQIEQRALTKLRHPSLASEIVGALPV